MAVGSEHNAFFDPTDTRAELFPAITRIKPEGPCCRKPSYQGKQRYTECSGEVQNGRSGVVKRVKRRAAKSLSVLTLGAETTCQRRAPLTR
jgi:hypothetical protein